MHSSISRSRKRFPWLAVHLLFLAVATWIISVLYTLTWSPETNFFRDAAKIKMSWAEKLTAERGAKIIIFGGSSCAFSIDGERLLTMHNMPVANFGLGAGLGAKVLTLFAIESIRPGDTLVVAVEPGLLTESFEPTSSAVQFSFAMNRRSWVEGDELGSILTSPSSALLALRPGAQHTFTMLGKIMLRKPLFAYRASDIRPSGWQQTDIRHPLEGPPGHGTQLSKDALTFLRSLRSWANEHNIRIVYSLPWGYTPLMKLMGFREQNAKFLLQIHEFLPVLKDPVLGADPVADHFSDTFWHLTWLGAKLRTDSFAQQLKLWNLWTTSELVQLSQQN